MDQVAPERVAALREDLSPDEIARAKQYRFEAHRRRFVACRGLLRSILARYLACPAARIEFEYGQWGKPRLAHAATSNSLEFNVTHSQGLALIAVTSGVSIGIDIETSLDRMDIEQIAREVFSPSEIDAILQASPDCRRQLFLRHWTRREAVLKAAGLGLAALENSRRLQEMDELAGRCEIRDLHPVPEGVAALATI